MASAFACCSTVCGLFNIIEYLLFKFAIVWSIGYVYLSLCYYNNSNDFLINSSIDPFKSL